MRTMFLRMGLLCCALQTQGLAVDGFPASFSSDNIIAPCAFTEACGDCGADCVEGSADKYLSWLKQGDHCFDDFISPMTNPVFFEDPRTLTEARMIFLNHALPASLGGQNVQVYAMQLRAALTERLSLIATKDGFIVSDSALLNDGWADINAGLKYNLRRDPYLQTLLSVGATYEASLGTPQTRQGNGDGVFHLFASGGAEIADGTHWLTGTGFRLPADTKAENQVWYWSNHLDKKLWDSGVYLFGETNWYHYMSSGTAFGLPIEGGDLLNLGSVGIAGNDLVTGAVGLKIKPSSRTEIGVAWETYLSDRQGLMKDRLIVDWIFRY
ncbi:MAG: hypothetical protein P8K08_24595 [Fuerstiella sp.]|nr:hypothetical protein [Fuerstiella sp.]